MKLNMRAFYHFCQSKFKLEWYANKMKDSREQPQIPASMIFLSVFCMVVWIRKSFLQLDQFLRSKGAKGFFNSDRMPTVSDSTIQRVLKVFEIGPIREFLGQIYNKGKQIIGSRLEIAGKKLRIGAIDGSGFGKFLASCFLVVGKKSNLWLDAEPMEKKGKELPTSHRLLARLVERFGKGFIDLILLDGLYIAQDFLNFCLSCRIDFVVKSKEVTLNIISDAQALFDSYPPGDKLIEYQEGFDDERLCHYKVWAASGFALAGVSKSVKVAKVEEFYPKNKKKPYEIFFVISSREDISALGLRELGHTRWQIENNGFKQLNAVAHTKRVFTHDAHAFLVTLLIFFTAFNLLFIFSSFLDINSIHDIFGKVKFTIFLVCSALFISLFSFL